MKKFLAVTTAAAALMLGASGALAVDENKMYITGEGSSRMVMGGTLTAGAPVLEGENGAAPANCPEGSFYEGAQEQIFACGDDQMGMSMMAPEAGAMMADGTAYPEGSMMLESRENQQ